MYRVLDSQTGYTIARYVTLKAARRRQSHLNAPYGSERYLVVRA